MQTVRGTLSFGQQTRPGYTAVNYLATVALVRDPLGVVVERFEGHNAFRCALRYAEAASLGYFLAHNERDRAERRCD